MARRSIVLTVFIAILVAACGSPSRPTTAPSTAPVAEVVTPPPTPSPSPTPTKPPPTKAPKPTKKPKPTPTPVAWSAAYRAHVCAAAGDLSDTKEHVDGVVARIQASDTPHARAEAFEVVALAVQANGEIASIKGWPPGDGLKQMLDASAGSLGDGATEFLDGLTSLDHDGMGKGLAEMATGGDQLAQAQATIAELSTTYGPAGC